MITKQALEHAQEAARAYIRVSSRREKDATSFVDGFLAREHEIKELKAKIQEQHDLINQTYAAQF